MMQRVIPYLNVNDSKNMSKPHDWAQAVKSNPLLYPDSDDSIQIWKTFEQHLVDEINKKSLAQDVGGAIYVFVFKLMLFMGEFIENYKLAHAAKVQETSSEILRRIHIMQTAFNKTADGNDDEVNAAVKDAVKAYKEIKNLLETKNGDGEFIYPESFRTDIIKECKNVFGKDFKDKEGDDYTKVVTYWKSLWEKSKDPKDPPDPHSTRPVVSAFNSMENDCSSENSVKQGEIKFLIGQDQQYKAFLQFGAKNWLSMLKMSVSKQIPGGA